MKYKEESSCLQTSGHIECVNRQTCWFSKKASAVSPIAAILNQWAAERHLVGRKAVVRYCKMVTEIKIK